MDRTKLLSLLQRCQSGEATCLFVLNEIEAELELKPATKLIGRITQLEELHHPFNRPHLDLRTMTICFAAGWPDRTISAVMPWPQGCELKGGDAVEVSVSALPNVKIGDAGLAASKAISQTP